MNERDLFAAHGIGPGVVVRPPEQPTFRDRLVRAANGCLRWPGPRTATGGYGFFRVGERRILVHRFAFELAYGELAEGEMVLHADGCYPDCAEPTHLRRASVADRPSVMRLARREGPAQPSDFRRRQREAIASAIPHVEVVHATVRTVSTEKARLSTSRAEHD